jgi:hypothetical protein
MAGLGRPPLRLGAFAGDILISAFVPFARLKFFRFRSGQVYG